MNNNSIEMIRSNQAFDTNEINFKNKLISFCVVYTVLAVLGTVHLMFAVINFLFCIYVVALQTNKLIIPFLVYATFFASIFKVLQITQISLFTLVVLIYIIKLFIVSEKNTDTYFLIFIFFLIITLIVQVIQGNFDINRNIKFYLNLVYMYIVSNEIDYLGEDKAKANSTDVLYAFIFGVLASSVVRLIDGPIFRVMSFVGEKTSNLGIGTEMYTRFSGLYGDPNYYAINTILVLVVLAYLFSRKKMSPSLTMILFIIFTVFSIMTRSKSALLMLPIPLFNFVRASQKRKNHLFTAFITLSILVIICLVLTNKITWFDSILKRFEGNTDLNDLTTGRYNLWSSYFDYFSANPLLFLFGSGISTPLLENAAAHNTYIDVLYHLGVFGGLFFVAMIKKIIVKNNIYFKRDINCYGPLIVVAMMYFFISSLFDIDLATNIILITITQNTYFRSELDNVNQY